MIYLIGNSECVRDKMRDFFYCCIYLLGAGFASFLLGRILPKRWFDYTKFPYKLRKWEKDRGIYNLLRVQKWKDSLPDMTKILPSMIPDRKIPKGVDASTLKYMIEETCVAEFTHKLLMVLGFGCVSIMQGVGGWIISVMYLIGNIPFNISQRFNRLRLVKIYEKYAEKKEAAEGDKIEMEACI